MNENTENSIGSKLMGLLSLVAFGLGFFEIFLFAFLGGSFNRFSYHSIFIGLVLYRNSNDYFNVLKNLSIRPKQFDVIVFLALALSIGIYLYEQG